MAHVTYSASLSLDRGQSELLLHSNVLKEFTAASRFFHVGVAYAAAMREACAGFLFGAILSAILYWMWLCISSR